MAAYYVWSGATGGGTGANWANAFTTLTTAFVTEVAGDTLYVAHDHVETTAANVTLTSSGTIANPTKVICVNRTGSVPPVSADRRATAQVVTTGASSISCTGFTHYDGIIFIAGDAGGLAHIVLPSAGSGIWLRFDNCSLRLNSTGSSSRIFMGNIGTAPGGYVELNNTTMSFASTFHVVDIAAMTRWRNTPAALIGTAVPTLVFGTSAARAGSLECIGVDLSAAGSGKTIVASSNNSMNVYRFIDCKLNAAATKSVVPPAPGSVEIDFVRSGTSGINYTVHRHRVSGLLTEETTIVRTGGATDGATPLAWKIVTTGNCNYSVPYECPPIVIWNDTVGSPVTATVEGIAAALPTDGECWVEAEFLGDASSPQGSFVNDGTPDLLTTAASQATSTATWGGSTTAFKLAVTFTPQQKGWVYARVKCAKASSTLYIDPLVTLT